jgi:hypothetical protein
MAGKSDIKVIFDNTQKVLETLRKFRKDAVLVGIPQADAPRDDDAPMNNAAILFLNEFGSPAGNIPARPVMAIGIRKAQPDIVNAFRAGARKALSGNSDALTAAYNRAGIVASVSVKKVINDQEGIKPPSDATLAHRRAMGFKGEKALLVTGQMRNAITYVTKEGL